MANFALIAADGMVMNIVVADRIGDVAVPDGQTILPVGPDAEIGGTHDGTVFVSIPRPPPSPLPPEQPIILALRELAAEIGVAAVAKIDARFGPAR